jgi:hypothetical protein
MPRAKAASKPIGRVRRGVMLLCLARAACSTAWAETPSSPSTSTDPRANTIELHLPPGFTLADADKFTLDLGVGLEQDGLLLDAEPESHPPRTARAVVTLTEPEPEMLRITVVSNGGRVRLSRDVRRSELPSSGQGLALAVLVEELVRASLAEAIAAPPPEEARPKPTPPPPRSGQAGSPPQQTQVKGLERYLGLGPLGLVFTDSSLYLGGSGALGLGTRRWRVELTFAYGRLLDVAADAGASSAGTAHGELGLGGANAHLNLLRSQRLWLGPLATFKAGISTFWAEGQQGYAEHTLSGPFVSAGGGMRLGAQLRPVEVNLDVALAAPLAGVTATLDATPILSTASAHGSLLFTVGVLL